MLFRPYKPIYILRAAADTRLIRSGRIVSQQLGKLVVDLNHSNNLSKVINDASIQNMKIFVQAEVKKALSKQKVLLKCLINWE
jgi:hypothetical protein